MYIGRYGYKGRNCGRRMEGSREGPRNWLEDPENSEVSRDVERNKER